MLRILTIIFFAVFFQIQVFAEENSVVTASTPTTPQNIPFENCIKSFNTNKVNLFTYTISAINANKFKIDEIQTVNGYILFTANKKKYLATIIEKDAKNSFLKITPCDNIYIFPYGIITNIHKYIELKLQSEIN